MQIKLKKLPRHKQMEILAWVKATGGRASRRPRRPLSRALLSEIVAPPFDPELEDDATAHAGSRSIICKFVQAEISDAGEVHAQRSLNTGC